MDTKEISMRQALKLIRDLEHVHWIPDDEIGRKKTECADNLKKYVTNLIIKYNSLLTTFQNAQQHH